MGLFDGLLGGGGGGGGVDYAGLLSGSGNIDYNKLLQQELANADNAKWGALAGALADAGMPSRLPIPIGSAIGKAAAAFSGGDNNSLLKILQIQKLATETQSLKELSELRKSLPADMKGLLDDIVKVGGAPGAGQPNAPSGDGASSGTGTPTGGGGGGSGTGGGGGASLAMAAPIEVQEQVAKKIATTDGLQHWAPYNAPLRTALASAGLPLSGPILEDQWPIASSLIKKFESRGGQNIKQEVVGPNGGYNPSTGTVTGPSSASGPWQITNTTWRAFGGPNVAASSTPGGAAATALPVFTGGQAGLLADPKATQQALADPGDYGGDGGEPAPVPGDLVRGGRAIPGQGNLAIPSIVPPMPAAPPGGLLALPQDPAATAAPFAGPGPLGTPPAGPVAPPAVPGVPPAPPAVRPGPSYMPQMPAGMNEQQMLALQARVAQLRAKAALGGITGDPFAGYAHLLENSPAYQRQKALIEQQMKYYGPEANVPLQSDLAGGRAGAETPWKNIQEHYKTDEAIRQAEAQARLNDILKAAEQRRSASTEFETETVQTPDGRYETRRVPKYQLGRKFDPSIDALAPLPGVAPTGASPAEPSTAASGSPQQQGDLVLPKPQEGYEWIATPQGPAQRPIQGTPAAKAETEKQQGKTQTTDIVAQDIGRALALSNGWTTGAAGGALKNFPGTGAYQLDSILSGMKGNIGLDRIQQLRQQSPTGGALGSVSEGEHKIVQSVYGDLTQSQDRAQFEFNLKRLHNVYMDTVNGSPEKLEAAVKEGKISSAARDAMLAKRYDLPNVPMVKPGGSAGGGGSSTSVMRKRLPNGITYESTDGGKTWDARN